MASALAGLVCPVALGQQRAMDTEKSLLKIQVYRAGLFSLFAHNHEIAAPIVEGAAEIAGNPSVELRVDARKLRVLDPDLAPDKRAEVQKAMEGPEVLDSTRFPEIVFRSTSVEKSGPQGWTVRGNLSLHGQTRPVTVEVVERDGRYLGAVPLKQRDFGITPIRIAGGTVRVKDEVRIEFEIVLVE